MNGRQTEDVLSIAVDFSPNDMDLLMVSRRKGDSFEIIKVFTNKEAVDLYNKLIGKENEKPIVVSSDFIGEKHNNTTSKTLERYKKYHKGE